MTGRRVFLAGCLLAPLAGCAGYQLGAGTLYRPEIRTIHVPIFRNDSLRRGLGERLTEAVVKKIERVTPYRVTTANGADSTLEGRILLDQKVVVSEDQFDAPRNIEAKFVIEVQWIDRNGVPLMQLSPILIPDGMLTISESANFLAEPGQSLLTAHQQVIEQLADQIVGQMQVRW